MTEWVGERNGTKGEGKGRNRGGRGSKGGLKKRERHLCVDPPNCKFCENFLLETQ